MKRIINMFLAAALFFTALFSSTPSYASGWLDVVKEIELNTIYTEVASHTDVTMGNERFYYDAFKLAVPTNGKITIKVESANDGYFNATRYYFYSAKDVDNELYDTYDNKCTEEVYSEARGVRYRTYDVFLNAGEYYFVSEYGSWGTMWDDEYTFSLSYKPSFPNTSLSKVSAKKKAFKANWKKASGVTGYEIQYSTKKNMKSAKKVKIKKASSTSKTIKKLKAKKKYYVRIRTYKIVKINGKKRTYYGKWSSKKTVKTK